MCELGYLLRTSRSRYLLNCLAITASGTVWMRFVEAYSSQKAMLYHSISKGGGRRLVATHVIRKPVVPERIDIFLHYYGATSATNLLDIVGVG